MESTRFDYLARMVSRRGIVATIVAGLVAWQGPSATARVGRCGGRPNIFTRHCNGAGSCESDSDCAAGCACVERRQGCCYTVKKKRRKGKRGGKGRRRCIDGAPALYCMRAA